MLVVARADGSHALAIAPAAGGARWSPRSDWIAYDGVDSHVHLIRPDGSGDHRVGYGQSPSWAPDGRRLIFSRFYKPTWQGARNPFGIVDVHGRLIASFGDSSDADEPVWSPRDNLVVYKRPVLGDPGHEQLFSVLSDGRQPRQLTHDRSAADEDPLGGIQWATKGPNRGWRLFYFRALCD